MQPSLALLFHSESNNSHRLSSSQGCYYVCATTNHIILLVLIHKWRKQGKMVNLPRSTHQNVFVSTSRTNPGRHKEPRTVYKALQSSLAQIGSIFKINEKESGQKWPQEHQSNWSINAIFDLRKVRSTTDPNTEGCLTCGPKMSS
ncbi:hypothetical protein ILYODFUR_028248 [Ilyodon furcidens]|uniref:Uncharacterized protein n=1 Tax=Ilyodon furcidens TaxID=33524 RepID=A0ABV0V6T3_9TELE